ncbi:MAG: trigger factor [Gemmatimonadota bacterium]|jgi:trigger factor
MTIEATDLKIDLEEKERWRRTLSVTVPASVVTAERRSVLDRLSSRMKLKGFRSGKVPASVVEQRYGAAVNQEVLDKVIGEAYKEALRLESLNPISQGEVDEVEYEPDQDLVFSISFDVHPKIEVARLGGFAIERPAAEVADADVDRVVERLRDQNAAWQPAEEGKPESGDFVAVTVHMLEDGEPSGEPNHYDLVLGEGDAIPDVEAAIHTLEPGQTADFHVKFPDDFPNEERRGQEQHLRITLEGRKTKDLPEVDDAFARSLGEFEDVETLRARIREDLEGEALEQAEGAVRGQIMRNILDANPFEVPDSMVDRYIESLMGDTEGADPQQLARARAEIRPEAERAVKRILLVEHIADAQGLRADENEIEERIEKIAEDNESTPAHVYAGLQKAGRLEILEREITENKVFEFLKDRSEIVQAD